MVQLARRPMRGKVEPFMFTGTTGEYYRVFMFNTLMTVLTLGLFSSWAKVRKLRYLGGNVFVLGGTFEFDASPVAILISRLVILLVLSLYVILLTLTLVALNVDDQDVLPGLGFGTFLTVALFPIAIIRSRSYMASHTLHNGIRFSYRKNYWQVLLMLATPLLLIAWFLLVVVEFKECVDMYAENCKNAYPEMPLLVLALGMAQVMLVLAAIFFPLWSWLLHRTFVASLSIGRLNILHTSGVWKYLMKSHLISLVFFLVCLLLFYLFFWSIYLWYYTYSTLANILGIGLFFLVVLSFPIFGMLTIHIYRAQLTKLLWQSVEFADGSKMLCDLSIVKYALVLFTNMLLVILSLGMLYPWAKVRQWHLLYSSIKIQTSATLGLIASGQSVAESALCAEIGKESGFNKDKI